jgi:acyl-CoA synthetase (AMP-forming)/AMP-acid ligase II
VTLRVIDYFDAGAAIDPDRAALIAGDAMLRYREVRDWSHRIAAALAARGFLPGQKVAVFSPNHPGAFLCMLGLWRAGGVWVPVNVRNAVAANIDYLNYAGTDWLFFHGDHAAEVAAIEASVPTLKGAICIDGRTGRHESLDAFAGGARGAVPDWADAHGNPEALMALIPTGGTTGPAKGVMMTQLAWGTMTELALAAWRCEDPVCLLAAPITHAAGVVATVGAAFGATNVVLPGFDAGAVLESIERHRVTHLFLPPTAFYALLDHPRSRDYDYSSLEYLLLAAAPVAPERFKQGVEVFGPCVCQCYGQVEAPMLISWLDPATVAAAARGDHPERLASCGLPTPAVRVAIMDDTGTLLPAGERGEIVVRGTLVAPGYHAMPDATAEIRAHGWHHTGDVGHLDTDGYLYIVDRRKDMIITGGFNVYCAEVEAALLARSEIRECAVIGVPDDRWGEAVKAVVVLRDGAAPDEEALIRYCKERLGSVKAPKSISHVTALPKTPNGKIDKKAIRREYWSGQSRNVH